MAPAVAAALASALTGERMARQPDEALLLGLEHLLNESVGAFASNEDRADKRQQLMREALTLINEIAPLSSDILERKALGAPLRSKMPSSAQYQYIKALDAKARDLLSAALEEVLINKDKAAEYGVSRELALTIWNSVQYTRMRVHDSKHRRQHHIKMGLALGASVAKATVAWLPGTRFNAMDAIREEHRAYYQSTKRPEYALALDVCMKMLASEAIEQDEKSSIAGMVIRRFLRKEETTIDQVARNEMTAAIRFADSQPTPVVDETWLTNELIRYAKDVYRVRTMRMRPVSAKDETTVAEKQEWIAAGPLSDNIMALGEKYRNEVAGRPLPDYLHLERWNKEADAPAFSAILKRLLDPSKVIGGLDVGQFTPEVRFHLMQQAMQIVEAIQDKDVRAAVFAGSVGGPASCNNRTLEVFSRLYELADSTLAVKRIETGEMGLVELAERGVATQRLLSVQQFMETDGLSGVADAFHPEALLSVKALLKPVLNLPDSVTKVNVVLYTADPQLLRRVTSHVQKQERRWAGSLGSIEHALCNHAPWRAEVIAMVKKHSLKDWLMLEAMRNPDAFIFHDDGSATYNLELPGVVRAFETDEQTRMRVIRCPAAATLKAARDQVTDLFRPKERDERRICSEINQLDGILSSARIRAEVELVAHVSKHLFSRHAARFDPSEVVARIVKPHSLGAGLHFKPGVTAAAELPPAGRFQPSFRLPDDWNARLTRLGDETKPLHRKHLRALLDENETMLHEAAERNAAMRRALAHLGEEHVQYIVDCGRAVFLVRPHPNRPESVSMYMDLAGRDFDEYVRMKRALIESEKGMLALRKARDDCREALEALDGAGPALEDSVPTAGSEGEGQLVSFADQAIPSDDAVTAFQRFLADVLPQHRFDFEAAWPLEVGNAGAQAGEASYVDAVVDVLGRAGLVLEEASGRGANCLIHSILAQICVPRDAIEGEARVIRRELRNRERDAGRTLGLEEFLADSGPQFRNLIDIVNERYPNADTGVCVILPAPGGKVNAFEDDMDGSVERGNGVGVMWVGNHYEPLTHGLVLDRAQATRAKAAYQGFVDRVLPSAGTSKAHGAAALWAHGFDLGTSHGSGATALIHTVLEQVGVTMGKDRREREAVWFQRELFARLGSDDVEASFGVLIDTLNDRYPAADLGVLIVRETGGGGLVATNGEATDGSTQRSNHVVLMQTDDGFAPIVTLE